MDEARYRAAERALWAHWGVEPRERWVPSGAGSARVRVLEVGDGAPVTFLHGASVAGSSWTDLASRLGDHRCLLIDRPGCGLSDPPAIAPGLFGLPALADSLLIDVLDGLGVDRAHVVATSMGGYFALRAAAAHPERVASITQLGWCLGAPVEQLPLAMRLAGAPGVGWLAARLPVSQRAVAMVLRQVGLAGALDGGRIPQVALAWNAALQNHTDTRIHEYRLAAGAGLQEQITALAIPADVLARVRVPVAVAFGTNDPFGTPESMRTLAESLPRGRIEVWSGAGHAPWIDDLDRAVTLVRQVVASSAGHDESSAG